MFFVVVVFSYCIPNFLVGKVESAGIAAQCGEVSKAAASVAQPLLCTISLSMERIILFSSSDRIAFRRV